MKKVTLERVINKIFRFISSKTDKIYTYHVREKLSERISIKPFKINNNDNFKIGIVIQGPLLLKDNFTVETIKLYIRIFPKSKIILSTWYDEDEKTIDEISDLNVNVVLNKKSNMDMGFCNTNLQIISTYNGIIEAEKLGCNYIIKTRTDQRIYAQNIEEYLISLLKKFPINKKENDMQNQRIIAINFFTAKYVPYNISDIFQFGFIDDMKLYWNGIDRRKKDEFLITGGELREKSFCGKEKFYNQGSENYLAIRFLKRLSIKLNNTLEDYYNILRDRFIVIDKETLDLYWNKYTSNEYLVRKYLKEEKIINSEQFSYKDWFILYSYRQLNEIDENMLKKYGYESIF